MSDRRASVVVILTSPKAGSGVGREQLPKLEELLISNGFEVHCTTSLDAFRKLTHDRPADQMPIVVAAGGDGTLSLVIETIPAALPVVPMPMGTENLLARYFGHSIRAEQVLETIQRGQSYWMDAGQANGKLFLVMATCGFDAEVVRGMHLTRRGHIRRYHYFGPIIRAIRRYRFPKIRVRFRSEEESAIDESFSCRWAMVFNLPRYGGNLAIEPDASADDGLLDLITFKKGYVLPSIRYLWGIVTRQHRSFRDVRRLRRTEFHITSERRVAYQLDGDYGGHLPLSIQILPRRVHLLLPTSYRKDS